MGTEEQSRETRNLHALVRMALALPPSLFDRVLTHSSWVENRTHSYERLEFLGDSVLGLAIASHLYERLPSEDEGRLAKLKAFVVSRKSCTVVARELGLPELINTHAPASDEERGQVARSATALGNILEALIGACFLVHGFGEVQGLVVDAFAHQIAYAQTHDVDHKSALQEYLATEEKTARYRLVATEGPPHERIFTSEVLVGRKVRGRGWGRSIKTSEQAAAREALVRFGVISEEEV
jgi:ribonuclease III